MLVDIPYTSQEGKGASERRERKKEKVKLALRTLLLQI